MTIKAAKTTRKRAKARTKPKARLVPAPVPPSPGWPLIDPADHAPDRTPYLPTAEDIRWGTDAYRARHLARVRAGQGGHEGPRVGAVNVFRHPKVGA